MASWCSLAGGGAGAIAVVKHYEIITLKYIGKVCNYILCTREYNSLGDPTRQHEV